MLTQCMQSFYDDFDGGRQVGKEVVTLRVHPKCRLPLECHYQPLNWPS